jgi:hypothetical protein
MATKPKGAWLSVEELSVLSYIIARARKRGLKPNDQVQFWDDATDAFDRFTNFNQVADRADQDLFQGATEEVFGDGERAKEVSAKVLEAITVVKDAKHPTLKQLMDVWKAARR